MSRPLCHERLMQGGECKIVAGAVTVPFFPYPAERVFPHWIFQKWAFCISSMKNIRLISFGVGALAVCLCGATTGRAGSQDSTGSSANQGTVSEYSNPATSGSVSRSTAAENATVNSPATAQVGSSANQGTVSEYGNPATSNQATSRTLAAQDLPQPVKSTVHRYTDDNSIHTIKEETKKGQTAYKIKLNRPSGSLFHPTLIVAADGSVLSESHMGNITEKDMGTGALSNR
jgi:hypothetical protein